MDNTNKPGCWGSILQALGFVSTPPQEETLPYLIRDDFLSRAELNFYQVLHRTVTDALVICPKVSLGDLFYAKTGERKTNQAYRNKINRKHVDFLLCNSQTMRPMLGIELDDVSHQRSDRQARDRFMENVFSAASLPLLRQPVQRSYNTRELAEAIAAHTSAAAMSEKRETESFTSEISEPTSKAAPPSALASVPDVPLCPKCEQPMVLRVVKKEGPHKGKQFWGCKDFPKCRGVRSYAE